MTPPQLIARPKPWVLEQNPKPPTPLPQQRHQSTLCAKPKSTSTLVSLYYLKCSTQRLCLTTLPSKSILLQHRFPSLFPKCFSNHISPFCYLRSCCIIALRNSLISYHLGILHWKKSLLKSSSWINEIISQMWTETQSQWCNLYAISE